MSTWVESLNNFKIHAKTITSALGSSRLDVSGDVAAAVNKMLYTIDEIKKIEGLDQRFSSLRIELDNTFETLEKSQDQVIFLTKVMILLEGRLDMMMDTKVATGHEINMLYAALDTKSLLLEEQEKQQDLLHSEKAKAIAELCDVRSQLTESENKCYELGSYITEMNNHSVIRKKNKFPYGLMSKKC
jgi:hypothetical protein